MMPRSLLPIVFLWLVCTGAGADGPADNSALRVRPVPPPGQPIPEADRTELSAGLAQLGEAIARLRAATNATNRAASVPGASLWPDVQIFCNAVDYALRFDEFLNPTNDLPVARRLLREGRQRAAELEAGQPSWIHATGLVVRGYVSKIDHSVQPYGLVIPPSFASAPERPRRLDAWFHGRDEKLTELKFLHDRQTAAGEFVPPDSFVLHLYGRYCNANKFAGEIDLFEALDDVRKHYRLDEDRIVVRGFSMGGAACWQFAVHYPGHWAAAAPGAGFSETREFLRVFQNETVQPPEWEQKLWRWYDCPDYALNLFNLPLVAYSGELDKQKQAADIMAAALREQGLELLHVIGPQTGHKYHPESKVEINRRIDAIVARGRDPLPREVRFTTHTLRYHRSHWVVVDRLDEHWARASIRAAWEEDGIQAVTENITGLTFEIPPGLAPFANPPTVVLDGQPLAGPLVSSDRSWRAQFRMENGHWTVADPSAPAGLEKRPGLQGPIDDAFMDRFVFVLPSGTARDEKVERWVQAESRRAIEHWRKQFRGEPTVIRDRELTDELIRSAHLVLWGDPAGNSVLGRILSQLPLTWSPEAVRIGSLEQTGPCVPALIFPNPLNPERYVVLNSGFTFREYDYLNNARQVAKLPDYALIDLSSPPDARDPGRIAGAGFFDEQWQVK